MDEIVPGLWLGDFASAMDTETLKAKGVQSVLSAMRGKVTGIHQTFFRHQTSLDDIEDADILMHLEPAAAFISAELAKGRGVLVHCQAGISRSSTIVAAYLMKSRNLSPMDALNLVRNARPIIDPNPGFLRQLNIFHEAGCVVSHDVASVRRFYMERKANELNGTGSFDPQRAISEYDELESGIKYSSIPSQPICIPAAPTPSPPRPRRRRIRCKMCRQELATREHMLDHGQIGPPTPRSESPPPVVVGGVLAAAGMPTMVQSTSESRLPSQLTSSLVAPPSNADGTLVTPIVTVPPILTNPRCSGYFVELLKWMDPFLKNGELSGKIVCPNKRCKAKLGNYDWAGVGCGCGQWVTPGFCVNRSKVDEVTV